jgi:hypothetical protein
VAIIVLGVALRIPLLNAFFLDFDESMHFQVAKEPTLAAAFESSRQHTHPPLAFLLFHLCQPLGDTEPVLRLPSLVLTVAALWMAFLWLQRLVGRTGALVGLCVLTFSLPMVHLSALMRGYYLLLMFVFSALYLQEGLLGSHAVRHVVAFGACLALAMLTHYAAAWIILVLGVGMLLRVLSGTLPRRVVLAWAGTQLVLAAICVGLYVSHVERFVGTAGQREMWDYWLDSIPLRSSALYPVKLFVVQLCRFYNFIAGPPWMLCSLLVATGAVCLGRAEYRRTRSWLLAAERVSLVVLPLLLAGVLLNYRVYPLGPTRHSVWLMPAVAAGIAAASQAFLARHGRLARTAAVGCLAAWIVWTPLRTIHGLSTTQTPALMRQTAALIQRTIPRGSLILTDDSTRNVLDYYLARDTVNHGRALEGGYVEYDLGGYRVVTVPRFHFFQYPLRDDLPRYQAAVGEAAFQPLWVVYLGFEQPHNSVRNIGGLLPPLQVLEHRAVSDNHLLHVCFNAPDARAAPERAVTVHQP